MPRKSSDFMNGVPELVILGLFKNAQEMYGYEVVAAIRDNTTQTLQMGEGVVYPSLHELERIGCLKSRRQVVSGRTRVYYHLTPKGRRRLIDRVEHWQRVTTAITQVIGGQTDATASS